MWQEPEELERAIQKLVDNDKMVGLSLDDKAKIAEIAGAFVASILQEPEDSKVMSLKSATFTALIFQLGYFYAKEEITH